MIAMAWRSLYAESAETVKKARMDDKALNNNMKRAVSYLDVGQACPVES